MVFISLGLAESRAPQRTLRWAALVCRGLCWHSPGEGRGLCSRGPLGLRLLGSLLLQLPWGGAGPGAAQPPALCTRSPVSPCGVVEGVLGGKNCRPRAGRWWALVCLLGTLRTVPFGHPPPALCPRGGILARMEPSQGRPQAGASPGSEVRPSASPALASHGLLCRVRDMG